MRVLDLFKMIEEIIGKKIKFNFDTGTDSAHYEITPYTFNPKPGKNIVRAPILIWGKV